MLHRHTNSDHPEISFIFPRFLFIIFSFCGLDFSTVPDHAHFLCRDFDSAIRLAAEPPLADLIETIWIVGGVQLYKVNQ